MVHDIAQLQREIATIAQAITMLEGQPEAQRPLRVTLAQRKQRLAELLGYADRGPALPRINLIAQGDTLLVVEDDAAPVAFPSPFGQSRLADLLNMLRNELLVIASDLGNGQYAKHVVGTPELCVEALHRLAANGYYLWQMLFADSGLNRFAVRLCRRGMDTPLQLNLITPGLVIPWHLIYDRDPGVGIALDGFWGLRHLLLASPQATLPERHLPDDSAFMALAGYYLSFAEESGDPEIVKRQQALVQRLVPEVDTISRDAEFLERLRSGSNARLLYLFCHVAGIAPALAAPRLSHDDLIGTSGTRLILSKNGGINLKDLWQAAPIESIPCLRGHPLVLLNACGSAAQSPLSDIGLVSFFFRHGAEALIGSECKVPVVFGDAFGATLLEALFTPGQSVGAAMRAARRLLIERENNPLGMIYNLIGRADMRLVAKPQVV